MQIQPGDRGLQAFSAAAVVLSPPATASTRSVSGSAAGWHWRQPWRRTTWSFASLTDCRLDDDEPKDTKKAGQVARPALSHQSGFSARGHRLLRDSGTGWLRLRGGAVPAADCAFRLAPAFGHDQ